MRLRILTWQILLSHFKCCRFAYFFFIIGPCGFFNSSETTTKFICCFFPIWLFDFSAVFFLSLQCVYFKKCCTLDSCGFCWECVIGTGYAHVWASLSKSKPIWILLWTWFSSKIEAKSQPNRNKPKWKPNDKTPFEQDQGYSNLCIHFNLLEIYCETVLKKKRNTEIKDKPFFSLFRITFWIG